MILRADNVIRSGGAEISREVIGNIEITKISFDLSAGRLLVKFIMTGYSEQHYMFGRTTTAALWAANDLDNGADADKAKALLLAEIPAFNSVARVAWNLPNMEVSAE